MNVEESRARAVLERAALDPTEATGTLLALARQWGIALTYENRDSFEARIDRPLTEQEWDRLKPELDDYAEWLDVRLQVGDEIGEWIDRALDIAGIDREED